MAGFATRASFAGHPSRSATTGHALTFNPDHLMGAGQLDAPLGLPVCAGPKEPIHSGFQEFM
jgi:hypothetical protein